MRLRLVSKILCSILALSLGCAPASHPVIDGVSHSPYYPLEVGNTWTYEHADGKKVVTVARHAQIGQRRCALVRETFANDQIIEQHLFADKNGLYVLSINDKILEKPMLILKLPPATGATWNFRTTSQGIQRQHQFVITKDSVEAPYGSFQCIRVDVKVTGPKESELQYSQWYAENVGMVKQTVSSDGTEKEYLLTAKSKSMN